MIKKSNNLNQAEQIMRDLLKDSANIDNDKVWNTLFDVLNKKYLNGNEALYLKRPCDTTQFYNNIAEMFKVAIGFDSIQVKNNKSQKEINKSREKYANMLLSTRANLFNGGVFFIRKKDYNNGFDLLSLYITTAQHAIFSSYNLPQKDKYLPEAAYWTVFCGYKTQDANKVLCYASLALTDSIHHANTLQYLADTYKMNRDTIRYEQTLKEGFDKYPVSPFFFSRLIAFYANEDNYSEGLNLVERALAIDSLNRSFRFAKSSILYHLKRYDQSIDICKSLLAEKDTTSGILLNIGLSYFNKAEDLSIKVGNVGKNKSKINSLYTKALGYLEEYRKREPQDKDKWAVALYTIYLNLNMGKEFEEIDKLLRK
ncbi:tetratricopeptide repeat protein [Hoylesella nanceiensis]